MHNMNVFQQCWENWMRNPYHQPATSEHVWINELNQAVFSALEKNLPSHIRIKSVSAPAFIYRVTSPAGVDIHTGIARAERVVLPDSSFETRVGAAVDQLRRLIEQPNVRTVFFYSPVIPLGAEDLDGGPNRRHMLVRMMTTCHDNVLSQEDLNGG